MSCLKTKSSERNSGAVATRFGQPLKNCSMFNFCWGRIAARCMTASKDGVDFTHIWRCNTLVISPILKSGVLTLLSLILQHSILLDQYVPGMLAIGGLRMRLLWQPCVNYC